MYKVSFAGLLLVAALSLAGCEKDEDIGGTAVEKMAGEWWVQLSINNTLVVPNYYRILTYNTADNSGSQFWIDDQQRLWPFKFKSDVNISGQTFSVTNATSEYSNIKITVQNGKVLTGVSKGPVSLAVTDSIYFEAQFTDDPGVTYQLHGYRRTRFSEDDH
ncbi:lipid-binding protein [Paraflavitalea pollutisoli]|uniref:lipid-binding protein n=1 Tax=Paraflavitalea pollutisoli TaxID=3034143 RepID=UPI0023EB86DA|nr:lipid-binding protein [Paraflavitalea sp. H1-2-19X]